MAIAEAASGQVSDNAGKANSGIDDAITAALDASDTEDLSSLLKSEEPEKDEVEAKPEPKAKDKEKSKPKPKAKAEAETEPEEEGTGDEADGEDAAEAKAKPEESEEETDDPLSAPKHWPEADKQAFAKLTKEGQEIALRLAKNLEGGFTRKSQELSDTAKFAQSVRGLFDDPTRQQLQRAGTDELGYIRHLHSLQQFASQKPVEYVKWAMQNLGVTPDHLGISQTKPQEPQTEQPAADDDIAKLLADPKVAQLEAELAQLKGVITREQMAKQQAEEADYINSVNTLNGHIKTFRESLDDNGHLKFPHFDEVKPHMAALMQSDSNLSKLQDGPEKLEKAYDMAVWARPDLRQSLIDSAAQVKIAEAQKKRDAERAKKVTSVKPAASVISTKPRTNSLTDALEQSFSKLGL